MVKASTKDSDGVGWGVYGVTDWVRRGWPDRGERNREKEIIDGILIIKSQLYSDSSKNYN